MFMIRCACASAVNNRMGGKEDRKKDGGKKKRGLGGDGRMR